MAKDFKIYNNDFYMSLITLGIGFLYQIILIMPRKLHLELKGFISNTQIYQITLGIKGFYIKYGTSLPRKNVNPVR